jgi:hypothetical protein
MDYIDVKYIHLISSRFLRFKKVKDNLYNFRCPLCNDSQRSKNKARGYLYQIKNNTNYKCHNCGVNISFNNFLKQLDTSLHKQYIFEKFKDGHTGKNFVANKPEDSFTFQPNFESREIQDKINLPKASENPIAKNYLENRKLNPDNYYYTEKFKEWTNAIKSTFDDVRLDEPRIVIPLFYKNKFIGYQGRAIGHHAIKYITIMFDDEYPKIYGLDKIQKNKTVYVTEGPFDSDLIENSIALCGSDGNVEKFGIRDCVWIYDNEPRNLEIHNRINHVIERGYKVVIWPSSIFEKDINELIINGLTSKQVMEIIEKNTYSGLEAKLQFTTWKKYERKH